MILVLVQLVRAAVDRRLVGAERDCVGVGERDRLCHLGRRHEGGEALRHAQQGKNGQRCL